MTELSFEYGMLKKDLLIATINCFQNMYDML